MITQTLEIFRDAYRELNSKKLFWITLVLSALFMAAFGMLGVRGDKLTLLRLEFPMPMAGYVYKQIFNWVVLWLWLTVAAVILALVSTGGIFPDFISGGSIDLYLSKPISRLRLFLTKYLAGLLFVLLQVSLFSLGSFLVLGLRAGEWNPWLFLAVPLVVTFFSYLFAVCVLLGVLTRSTVAALLLTILVWGVFFLVHKAEGGVLESKIQAQNQVARYQKQKVEAEAQLAELAASPPASATLAESRQAYHQRRLAEGTARLARAGDALRNWTLAHRILYGAKTVLPKTSETTNLIERWLFSDQEVGAAHEREREQDLSQFLGQEGAEEYARAQAASQEAQLVARNRSPLWVIGTSLGFEAVVLALAAWVFCRRDY